MVKDKLCIKLKKSLLMDFSFFVLGMKIYKLYATKSNQDDKLRVIHEMNPRLENEIGKEKKEIFRKCKNQRIPRDRINQRKREKPLFEET